MNEAAEIEILDISDDAGFARIPPCADPRFDHRSCDYWENGVRGSKDARPHWWEAGASAPSPQTPRSDNDNPFAPPPRDDDGFNPFSAAADEPSTASAANPFAPDRSRRGSSTRGGPRKLGLLARGEGIFGSYAKVLTVEGETAVYAQFGPLSAYPRAQQIRELYPRLPQSPLPAVITCIATTSAARGSGLGVRLVAAVCADLGDRGFAAIEAYPDLLLSPDEASAADAAFWEGCGFVVAAEDERYPVLRRELE